MSECEKLDSSTFLCIIYICIGNTIDLVCRISFPTCTNTSYDSFLLLVSLLTQHAWSCILFDWMGDIDCKEGLALGHLVSLRQPYYTLCVTHEYIGEIYLAYDILSGQSVLLNSSESTPTIKPSSTNFMCTRN
jgi:hypothetical protein